MTAILLVIIVFCVLMPALAVFIGIAITEFYDKKNGR
jgi:hypothetical protein